MVLVLCGLVMAMVMVEAPPQTHGVHHASPYDLELLPRGLWEIVDGLDGRREALG